MARTSTPQFGPAESETKIVLAYPLAEDRRHAFGLAEGADGDIGIGEEVNVTYETAKRLIQAGWAQGVDADRPEAVQAALRGEPAPAPEDAPVGGGAKPSVAKADKSDS